MQNATIVIFAYSVHGKYRLICFITREKFYTTYASYCYAFANLYEQLPVIDDLYNEYIIPLGYFTVGNFPAEEKVIRIGNMPEFKKLDITSDCIDKIEKLRNGFYE